MPPETDAGVGAYDDLVHYLDHASTAPLHPAAREVLLAAYDEGWADPARLYGAGRKARILLDSARERVALAFGARPDRVSFLPSGTASIEQALARARGHVVTCAVEHSAVLRAAGDDATVVGVDQSGRVDPDQLLAAVRPDTALVSLQHGNHEVGTLQPVAEVVARSPVPVHVDACQSAGRIPVDRLGAALVSASAHKWGGPPGVGVLVGPRQRDPAGFPNLPAVLAAAAALDARLLEMADEAARLAALVDRIRTEVPKLLPDVEVIGDPVDRLPHIVTFSVLYVDGEALVTELDRRGVAVNSGSSCTSDTLRPSHVLAAMGVLTHGNVRVSLGHGTTEADVDALLAALPEVVGKPW